MPVQIMPVPPIIETRIRDLSIAISATKTCHASRTAQGVRFKSPPVTITAGPNKGGLVAYLFDPDGYMLELFQPSE